MKRIEAVIVQSQEYPMRVSIRGADGRQGFRDALRDGGFVEGDRVVVILAQDYRIAEAEVARLEREYERGARDFADWVRGQEFNVRAHLATVEIEIKPDAVDRFMARATLAEKE